LIEFFAIFEAKNFIHSPNSLTYMRKLLVSALLVSPVLMQQAAAQNRSISGRVTDSATGQGLPGVTVLVKGTTVGASTNADGSYTLSVPATATTLSFSFIGYGTVDKPIGDASTVDVRLTATASSLDEVVISGLASTVKRTNLANSVATISAEELTGSTRPVTVDAALNGKLAGANISQNSGAPGGGLSVQLRGISTITGSSQPLYIIDGVYVNNEQIGNGAGSATFTGASAGTGRTTQDQTVNRLADLNPNDIESIEVLKGPSAAAIYGTRGNAGVIIIRTKRGKAGRPRVTLTQDVGIARAQNLLGKEDWTEAKIRSVFSGQTAEDEVALWRQQTAAGNIYDYEEEIFGNTGVLTNTALGVSGGGEKTKFYISGSTNNESGIVKRTGFQRNSIRANVDQQIGKLVDLSVTTNYINSQNRRGFTGNDNNGVGYTYTLAYTPSYHELHKLPNGLFPDARRTADNPLAIVDRAVNEESTNRFITGLNTTFHLIEREGSSLRFNVQGGVDFGYTENFLHLPSDLQSQRDLPNPGASRITKTDAFFTNLQGGLVYDWRVLDGALSLTSQIGTVRLTRKLNQTYNQGIGLLPGQDNPNSGTIITQNTYIEEQQDVGFFGQQEVNWRDRIIVAGGIRFDKSSNNGDVDKLYPFPKASVAVNIANFDFWTADAVNVIKPRFAYGQTAGVPPFTAKFSPLQVIGAGSNLGLIQQLTTGNAEVEPEQATELEAGIDLAFLQNRITFEGTVYKKSVFDILRQYTLAPGTGVQQVAGTGNGSQTVGAFPVGDLENRGIELSLGVTPVRNANISWTSTTQFWLNRSEVTKSIIPVNSVGLGFGNTFGRNLWAKGESPSRWFGTPADPNGLFGLTRYEDAQPKFQMSFLNQFTLLKNFELSFLVHWKKDGYISNLSRVLKDEGGTTKDWSEDSGQVDEEGNPLTRGQARQLATAREFIQNGGYIRLREASLYYTIPAAVRTSLFKDYVANIRLGVSGNNLVTFTDYVGYDPEVSNFGNVANAAFVDVGAYPNTRRMFFHLAVEF
jgi:TonB-linked SusC/RagA family outer membrane protein